MATQYTLAQLETDVKSFIEDEGTDFDTIFPQLVKLAEDRCLIDLDLTIFDATSSSISLADAATTATLPTDWIKLRSLDYVSSGSRVPMEQRTYEYCRDYWPSTTAKSAPLYWAPYNETTIYLAPTPDATYTATGIGVKRPNSLNTDTSGTWLSKYCGSLLLKACLVVSEQFDLADERVAQWKTDYAEDLARRRVELRHLIRNDYDME